MMYSIVHLVDDATVGGVTRTLDFIASSHELARKSVHKVVPIRRGALTAPRFHADMIVSHLSVSWANLPLFASVRAAYPKTPMVHIEHSYSERFVATHVSDKRRFETLMRSVTALFDHVVAVSVTQGRWMKRKGYCPGGRLSVIESCVDLKPFLATEPRTGVTPRIVGALGRAENQKGLDILVKAFKDDRLKAMELHIYGEGGQMEALKTLADERANIVFKGFAKDPVAAIAACDVIAMPSRWEPYGIVAVEAMASSRPIICARVDGTDAHINGGAIDVGHNTPEAWADMLSQLPSLDLEMAVLRGHVHAHRARRRFIMAWNALIDRVVHQPHEPEAQRLAA